MATALISRVGVVQFGPFLSGVRGNNIVCGGIRIGLRAIAVVGHEGRGDFGLGGQTANEKGLDGMVAKLSFENMSRGGSALALKGCRRTSVDAWSRPR